MPAGSACRSAPSGAGLAAKNVAPQRPEKGPRGPPLSDEQKAGNREKAKPR